MKRGLMLFVFIALFGIGNVVAQHENHTNHSDEEAPKVTIVKYSDYQCPACKYFVPIEEKLLQEFGSEIEIVTKHFPLRMHEHAQLAGRAVEAARNQDKFHEMHELIFAGQEQWARGNAEGIFLGYAKSLKLDMEQFRTDLHSAETQKIVMDEKQEGVDLDVNSTPTFFINGERVEQNPRTYEAFKELVDSKLQ